MKTKEITYVTHNLSIGGSQKVIINLANEALKQNFIVNIIVLVNDLYLLNNIKSSPNLKVFTCTKHSTSKGFIRRLIIGINLLKIINNLKPSFVHSHLWQIDIFYLILVKFFIKTRIIHTIHSPGGAYFMDSFSHKLNVYIERFLLNAFRKTDLIVVSAETGDVVKKVLHYKQKYYLIPNGIDVNSFDHNYIDEDPKIMHGRLHFVFPSRYQKSKGHLLLFEAFKLVLGKYPDVYLVLVGLDLRENLQEAAEALKIGHRVIFYGPTNKVAEILNSCQYGVFPSQYEGHPIALCEMMASRLPIVASDISANKFVSNDGQGASLFTHDSPGRLCEEMIKLIENKEYADQLSSAARDIIMKKFSSLAMFKSHVSVYEKV